MKPKTLTPLQSIRAKCLDCCSNKPSLVRKCEAVDCPLFFFKSGHNPRRKGICRFKGSQDSAFLMKLLNSPAKSDGKGKEIKKEVILYPAPLKSSITIEEAERIIKAANSIIATTNSLKTS